MPRAMAKKSYTKRVRVTKTGKLLRRKKGLGHSKTKKNQKLIKNNRSMTSISGADRSNVNAYLN
ncbi:MAG: 50S ribosomal protein L35 [Candidatus Colwellbacteria bacterium]|nr:50S ribosomal protein L35 [Candidatus Colwellbacteria bacterium]